MKSLVLGAIFILASVASNAQTKLPEAKQNQILTEKKGTAQMKNAGSLVDSERGGDRRRNGQRRPRYTRAPRS